MNTNQVQTTLELYWSQFMDFAPKIAGAVLIIIIGFWISSKVSKLTSRAIRARQLDLSLQSFLASLVHVSLNVLVVITAAGMIGIQTTSFVAILGAAGLAVGLALQGSLANFAGGVLILTFRPYKVGDLIETNGEFGEVTEIQIFNTIIINLDNKTVILPNAAVSSGKIINYTAKGSVRVNLSFQIEPGMDVTRVRQVIHDEVFDKNPDILKQPEASTHVLSHGNGMTVLMVHMYSDPVLYWKVYYGASEMIRKAFADNQIPMPIPHQVYIKKEL